MSTFQRIDIPEGLPEHMLQALIDIDQHIKSPISIRYYDDGVSVYEGQTLVCCLDRPQTDALLCMSPRIAAALLKSLAWAYRSGVMNARRNAA